MSPPHPFTHSLLSPTPSPPANSPPHPAPLPPLCPEDIIAAALHAIQNPDTPCPDAGPITLYNLNGLISNRTQAHFDEYKRNLLKNWIKDAWRFKSAGELAPISYSTYSLGQRANTTVPITLHDGTILRFRFQLERQTSGTLANCWLLEHYICQFRDQANTS